MHAAVHHPAQRVVPALVRRAADLGGEQRVIVIGVPQMGGALEAHQQIAAGGTVTGGLRAYMPASR